MDSSAAQVEHARDLVDVRGVEAQPLLEQRARLRAASSARPRAARRCRSGACRSSSSIASRRSSASSSSMERSALRVTRKRWWSSDLHAREEHVEVGGDDPLERARRCAVPTSHRRGSTGGTLMRAKRCSPLTGSRTVTASDSDRSLMYGNGMRRVDRERRQDREDLVHEALAQLELALRAGPRAGAIADARLGQLLADAPRTSRSGGPGAGARGPGCGRASRSPTGRRGVGERVACRDLLLETGDAHLEELVEVAREDGQEADALEQRVAGVLRLVEDARVELEPRELAVDERELAAPGTRRGAPLVTPGAWVAVNGLVPPRRAIRVANGRPRC